MGPLKQVSINHIIESMGFFKMLQNLSAILYFLRSVLTAVRIFVIFMKPSMYIHVQYIHVLQKLTSRHSVKYHFKCLGFWTTLNVNKIRIWHFFFFWYDHFLVLLGKIEVFSKRTGVI